MEKKAIEIKVLMERAKDLSMQFTATEGDKIIHSVYEKRSLDVKHDAIQIILEEVEYGDMCFKSKNLNVMPINKEHTERFLLIEAGEDDRKQLGLLFDSLILTGEEMSLQNFIIIAEREVSFEKKTVDIVKTGGEK